MLLRRHECHHGLVTGWLMRSRDGQAPDPRGAGEAWPNANPPRAFRGSPRNRRHRLGGASRDTDRTTVRCGGDTATNLCAARPLTFDAARAARPRTGCRWPQRAFASRRSRHTNKPRTNSDRGPDRLPNHEVRARSANGSSADRARLTAPQLAAAVGASLTAATGIHRSGRACAPAHACGGTNNNLGRRPRCPATAIGANVRLQLIP
jgi:hypothetical protein